jgi:hypothetical protein
LRQSLAGFETKRGDWLWVWSETRWILGIITWGVGDLLFINDVFPKDWESFFSGRPPEYLKLGVDGALVTYSLAGV